MREKTKMAKTFIDDKPFLLGDRSLTKPTSPITKILLHLANAKSDNERNRYRIKESTKLAKQTVYNGIKSLKAMGLISEKISKERSRTGLPIRNYHLTKQGWYESTLLDSRLIEKAEDKVGESYHKIMAGRVLSKTIYIQWLIDRLDEALRTGKAPPGWYFKLTTCEHGHIKINHAIEPEMLKKIEQMRKES